MAVCEGYSLAFEYLLHQANIPCACVSGAATHEVPDDIDNRGHASHIRTNSINMVPGDIGAFLNALVPIAE